MNKQTMDPMGGMGNMPGGMNAMGGGGMNTMPPGGSIAVPTDQP